MPIQLTKKSLDVGIVTRDGKRLHAFYRDVFGLEPFEDLLLPSHTLSRPLDADS